MTTALFVEKLTRLASIAMLAEQAVQPDETVYGSFDKWQYQFVFAVPLLSLLENDDDIVFKIPAMSAQQFVIKASDQELPDPPIYIKSRNAYHRVVESASTALLTVAAASLADLAAFVFRHYNLGPYPLLRQYFSLYCNESGFPNKIWLHKELDCYASVFANEEMIILVAANPDTLQNVKRELGLTEQKPSHTETQKFKSQLLHNGIIQDGVLSGYLKTDDDKVLSVYYETDSGRDFHEMVKTSEHQLRLLRGPLMIPLREQIIAEVTDAAYEQMDYKPQPEDYRRLGDALQLQQIAFFDDAYMLVFEAIPEFGSKRIYVQLSEDFTIDELSIS